MHLAGDADDVRCVPAAGALSVVHVNGATADRFQRILDEAGFIQRIGVDLDLKIVLVGNPQTSVDCRRHRAPVLVKFQAHHTGLELFDQRRRAVRIAASQETEIHRPGFRCLQHFSGVEGTAGINPDRDRSERTADHGGDPARQRMLDETGAVEMNVNIDRARRRDQPLAVAHRGAAGDDQARIDAVHDGGVAGLSEADDPAMADTEVSFDDPENGIDDDDVAKQEIQRTLRTGDTGHANSVTKGFAAAMQAFVAINGKVFFDHRRQRRVAEPDRVTGSRTVERRVVAAVDARHVTPL